MSLILFFKVILFILGIITTAYLTFIGIIAILCYILYRDDLGGF